MAISYSRETFAATGDNKQNQRSFTRTFVVVSTIANESPVTVEAATGVVIGSVYTQNGLTDPSLCDSIKSKQDSAAPTLWTVTCSYVPSPKGEDGQPPGGKPENPPKEDRRLRLPEIRIDKVERDTLFSPIKSSTGEPIIIHRKTTNPVVTISIWDWHLAPSVFFSLQDKINKTTWWGYDPHCWKLNVTADAEYEADGNNQWIWWRKTHVFECKLHFGGVGKDSTSSNSHNIWLDWDERPIDLGKMRIDPALGNNTITSPTAAQLTPITDAHGNRFADRQFLDGRGRPCTDGLPYFLDAYRVYEELDFAYIFHGFEYDNLLDGI